MSTVDDVAGDDELKEELGVLARQIRDARLALSWTVEELANRCATSYSTIYRLEEGNAGIAIGVIVRVLKVLDLPAPSDRSALHVQEELPRHALHIDSEQVNLAVEEAAREACNVLGEMLPAGTRPEIDGICSNFQGTLEDHLRAMLRGLPYYDPRHRVVLPKLIYSDDDLGRNYRLPEGADGFLVRVVGQRVVLEDGRFKSIPRASDLYTSGEAAAEALRKFVEGDEHPPGPVRIVPGYLLDNGGVGFAPSRSPTTD